MKALLTIICLCGFILNAMAIDDAVTHFCRPNQKAMSCQVQILLVCGEGYVDGCLSGQTDDHACVVNDDGALCKQNVQIKCPDNFIDGCKVDQTTRHVCVPVMGPMCGRTAKFVCPTGFTDDCVQFGDTGY